MQKKEVMSNSFGIVLAIPIAIAIVGRLPQQYQQQQQQLENRLSNSNTNSNSAKKGNSNSSFNTIAHVCSLGIVHVVERNSAYPCRCISTAVHCQLRHMVHQALFNLRTHYGKAVKYHHHFYWSLTGFFSCYYQHVFVNPSVSQIIVAIHSKTFKTCKQVLSEFLKYFLKDGQKIFDKFILSFTKLKNKWVFC